MLRVGVLRISKPRSFNRQAPVLHKPTLYTMDNMSHLPFQNLHDRASSLEHLRPQPWQLRVLTRHLSTGDLGAAVEKLHREC